MPNKDERAIELVERLTILYANLSGRESKNRAGFRKETLKLVNQALVEAYESGYIKGTEDYHYGDPYIEKVKQDAIEGERRKWEEILRKVTEDTNSALERLALLSNQDKE